MNTTSFWILGLLISFIIALIFWLNNPANFKRFIKNSFNNIFSTQTNGELLEGQFLQSIFWYGGDKGEEIHVDIDGDGIKEEIIIERDHPNGVKLLISSGKEVYSLGFEIAGLNDIGELEENYYCQLAVIDVTNDGIPDILLAVGNGLIDLHLNIWRFDKEKFKNTIRGKYINPFRYIGHIEGQQNIRILSGGKIEVPVGSFGRFSTYSWDGSKFKQIN